VRVKWKQRGTEFELETLRARYTIRETRKGELVVETMGRKIIVDDIDTRTVALTSRRGRS
jgi:hypothetical protein